MKTGYETTIMVTPRVLHTTESAQTMPFDDRQCRASSEAAAAGLNIFKQYSREACVFECSIRESRRKCGCTPWNYPLEESGSICDVYGNYCFHQAMKEATTNPTCDCPNDCRYQTCSNISKFKLFIVQIFWLLHHSLSLIHQ